MASSSSIPNIRIPSNSQVPDVHSGGGASFDVPAGVAGYVAGRSHLSFTRGQPGSMGGGGNASNAYAPNLADWARYSRQGVMFRGLRVRMGIATGMAEVVQVRSLQAWKGGLLQFVCCCLPQFVCCNMCWPCFQPCAAAVCHGGFDKQWFWKWARIGAAQCDKCLVRSAATSLTWVSCLVIAHACGVCVCVSTSAGSQSHREGRVLWRGDQACSVHLRHAQWRPNPLGLPHFCWHPLCPERARGSGD